MSAATPPHFPAHSQPRVWLITSASSPVGIAVSRALLKHGDFLVAGVKSIELSEEIAGRGSDFASFWEEVVAGGWRHRCRVVGLDERCEASSCFNNRMIELIKITPSGQWGNVRLLLPKPLKHSESSIFCSAARAKLSLALLRSSRLQHEVRPSFGNNSKPIFSVLSTSSKRPCPSCESGAQATSLH